MTVQRELFAADALRIMNDHKIGVLVVVDSEQKPQGIFHIQDLLRAGVV
ncbi:MAG: CBS domain-containing protein [Paracoccaceae bacterium]